MKVFRRALGPFVMVWMLCQALAVAPGAFWLAFAEAAPPECQCIHGDHAICPMHHRPDPGSTICLVGSPDRSDVAALAWLWNAAPAPALADSFRPEPRPALLAVDFAIASLRPAPPDPPPPRL